MKIIKIDGEPVLVYSGNASDMLGKDHWVLINDMTYTIMLDDKTTIDINVDRGYLTDGATVPRSLWSFVPVWDECTLAVLAHDYLCNYGRVTKAGFDYTLSRVEIDKIFLALLEYSRVSWIKYWVMYLAVRIHSKLTKTSVGISGKKQRMEIILKQEIDSGMFPYKVKK